MGLVYKSNPDHTSLKIHQHERKLHALNYHSWSVRNGANYVFINESVKTKLHFIITLLSSPCLSLPGLGGTEGLFLPFSCWKRSCNLQSQAERTWFCFQCILTNFLLKQTLKVLWSHYWILMRANDVSWDNYPINLTQQHTYFKQQRGMFPFVLFVFILTNYVKAAICFKGWRKQKSKNLYN